MKISFFCLLCNILFFFAFNAEANWLKTNSKHSAKETIYSAPQKKDSLPPGVTKDWLRSLRNEEGKNIIPNEGDAVQKKTFDGTTSGEGFGSSVGNAGDVNGDNFDDIIVGSQNYSANTGRAYIFFGGSNMNTTADVIMTGEAANNYFGVSATTAGDLNNDGYDDVIIGAEAYSSGAGRAYIYFGGASMNNIADVIMTGEAANDGFGYSASTAGDFNGDGFDDVIIGAYGNNNNTGKAYIYFGGSSMDNVADLTMIEETVNSFFATSVSTAGDVNGDGFSDVIASGNFYNSNTGRAYIYLGGTNMNNVADVIMTGELTGSSFGYMSACAGDVNGDGYSDVIIGAYGFSSSTGRAYIYFGGVLMDNTADVTMTGESTNNAFGHSVSGAGDINGDGFSDVIVGADRYNSFTGRAYVYLGGFNMNNSADIVVTGETVNSKLGYFVAGGCDVNGDGYSEMLAGSYGYGSNTGRAYLYDYTMSGNLSSEQTIVFTESPSAYLGHSVTAGDINGDGYSDVIIGTNDSVHIYLGGSVMDNVRDITLRVSPPQSFGYSVSCAGDVNGDGYNDIMVGAPNYSNTGRAYIFYGGSPMDKTADVILTGDVESYFSYSLSTAGDINNDGYSDVIVGGYIYNSNAGRAYVFLGGSPMDNIADMVITGNANDLLGISVSSAGDVNGDGYDDAIVGGSGSGPTPIGRVYILFGGTSMDNVPDVAMTGGVGSAFGFSVSSTGDLNNDGYSDVIVGAIAEASNTGKAYILFGGTSMDNVPDIVLTGETPGDIFGFPVSSAGDINNDQFPDLIISAIGNNSNTGKCYVYYGGPAMDNIADFTMTGEAPNNYFGVSVSQAGDVNGDEYSDLVVGAEGYNGNSGRAYINISSQICNCLQINLTMFIQGFYNAGSNAQAGDTIRAYLHNTNFPYSLVDSSKAYLSSEGNSQLKFSNASNGTYYLVIKHRNSIETWSSSGLDLTYVPAKFYNFSTSSSQAFGNNLKQADTSPVRFAIFSGDVNQDGTVDAADVSEVENAASNSVSGYVPTDVTGDNYVDAGDLSIVENNASLGVNEVTP